MIGLVPRPCRLIASVPGSSIGTDVGNIDTMRTRLHGQKGVYNLLHRNHNKVQKIVITFSYKAGNICETVNIIVSVATV